MKKEYSFSLRKNLAIFGAAVIIIAMFAFFLFLNKQSKTSRDICNAIQAGDNVRLEALLQEGADANRATHTILYLPIAIVTEHNMLSTPLLTACENGNTDAVALLLNNGADPNKRIAGGFNAMEAVYSTSAGRNSRFDIVPMLLNCGAEIDNHVAFQEVRLATDDAAEQSIALLELYTDVPESLTDSSGTTLLGKCHSPIVAAWLIGKGADVNASNDNGNTPLMYAAERGYGEVIVVLISSGADVGIRNNEGKTAYDLAVENGFNELLEILSPT